MTDATATPAPARERTEFRPRGRFGHIYAAIDLGTNNCRLLVARPTTDGFRVIDAFSRIVRLGEGLSASGQLSEAAMRRAIAALRICADKVARRGVTRIRAVATEACRKAENGAEFLDRVHAATGLKLEIINTAEEARLALAGCAPFSTGAVAMPWSSTSVAAPPRSCGRGSTASGRRCWPGPRCRRAS